MPRGRHTEVRLVLQDAERTLLGHIVRSPTAKAGYARRARLLLLLADGGTITDVAETCGIARRHVYKWHQRYVEFGLDGIKDRSGRGGRRKVRLAPPVATE